MPEKAFSFEPSAWDKFYNSRFRQRTPKVYYLADHVRGKMWQFGEYKTNKAKWAKQ